MLESRLSYLMMFPFIYNFEIKIIVKLIQFSFYNLIIVIYNVRVDFMTKDFCDYLIADKYNLYHFTYYYNRFDFNLKNI